MFFDSYCQSPQQHAVSHPKNIGFPQEYIISPKTTAPVPTEPVGHPVSLRPNSLMNNPEFAKYFNHQPVYSPSKYVPPDYMSQIKSGTFFKSTVNFQPKQTEDDIYSNFRPKQEFGRSNVPVRQPSPEPVSSSKYYPTTTGYRSLQKRSGLDSYLTKNKQIRSKMSQQIQDVLRRAEQFLKR